MSPLVQCIYFQLQDTHQWWKPNALDRERIRSVAVRSFFSFLPPSFSLFRLFSPLLLSTCVSINFKGKLVNRSPLFSLTRPGYMHTRHSGISILNKEALFDVEYERTNQRTNRIESSRNYPAQSFNSIVLNIIFHAAVIHTTNLSNILPRWIFLFVRDTYFL